MVTKPLNFKILSRCNLTRARTGVLTLKQPHNNDEVIILTPIFMPVGTSGTMKGILPEQLENTGCRLMLSNTYHLASRPGADVIEDAGGLHKFMRWKHAILTDSGGFQMVSLSKLAEIKEEGARFISPYNFDQIIDLTPEKVIKIQHKIGSNIIMQLDDVISSTGNDFKRFKEASERSIRWYDRCVKAHEPRKMKQNLFPIIQGGLNWDLRLKNTEEIVKRDSPGIAIGGLSGGEDKNSFIEMVNCSTLKIPEEKPRYLMGVGFAVDLILCVALGCDMFDCVFPTRTARFGYALIGLGTKLNITSSLFKHDFCIIEKDCDCNTCKRGYNRSYIHHLLKIKNPVACHLLTQHNIRFQLRFMQKIRNSIENQSFEKLIMLTLDEHYKCPEEYPIWVKSALKILSIKIDK